jgi:hypothetical protein
MQSDLDWLILVATNGIGMTYAAKARPLGAANIAARQIQRAVGP